MAGDDFAHDYHKFRSRLAGGVIVPGDSEYEKLRQVWNHAADKHPLAIVQCVEVNDVIRGVEFARENNLLTAVRSGGHGFAGHGTCEGGIVIDLSMMKRAKVDRIRDRVQIEPGIRAGELDHITQAFGMAVPIGSCPSVGVMGYSLGGGESSLTPKFGYACDSIVAAELITANAEFVRARPGENEDLFWAIRGAGANFGIVTSLEFRMHEIERVLAGHLKYPIRQAREVLRFLSQYARSIPDELFIIAAMLPFPGERELDIGVVWPGDEKEGERVLAPLRQFIKPAKDSIEMKAYLDEQRAGSDAPSDADYASCRRGGHLEDLTDEAIDTIMDHASRAPSEASGITMMYWHGPWVTQPHDNAFGFRRAGYEYWVHSYWQEEKAEELRAKATSWVEEFFTTMNRLSTGAVYVNDLEEEGEVRARAAYGEHYDRLAQIKAKYDPDNFFRVNQNIRPAK